MMDNVVVIQAVADMVFYGVMGFLGGMIIGKLHDMWKRRTERMIEFARNDAHRQAVEVVFEAVANQLKRREESITKKIDAAVRNKNGMFRKADAEQICRDLLRGIVTDSRYYL